MNTDTLSGKVDQVKGQVKQSVGEAIGNDRLANSGTADQVKGNAKEGWGNVKDAFHSTSSDVELRSNERRADAKATDDEAAHNVRQSVVNASEKVKEFVSGK